MVKRMDDSTARKIEDNDILACVDALSQQLETEENKHVLNVRETENSVILEMAKDMAEQEPTEEAGYHENEEDEDDKKNREFVQIAAEIKAGHEEDEKGSFEGYGSIFGNVDLGNDVIQAGAFQKSIKKTGPKGVKLLYQHKTDMPIGVFESIEEDQKGLKVKGRLAMGTQAGRETYELMKMGALDGLSIGFKTSAKGAHYDPKTRRRMIKEVELMEISVVTFPMNPRAKIRKVKGQDVSIREWENGLRDAFSLSRSEAKIAAKAVQDAFYLRDAEIEKCFEVDAVKQLTQKLKSLKED